MDSDDEFDDDIADEDLIIAASQAPSRAQPAKVNQERFQPHVQKTPIQRNAANPSRTNSLQRSNSNRQSFIDLEDIPIDAFSSPPVNERNSIQSQRGSQAGFQQQHRVGGPIPAYRQTTLFGQTIQQDPGPGSSQTNRNRAFRADLPPEPPTHHELDKEAMKTWVYPTNLGPTRDYQFSIVKNGLFNNTLVALPTGLGKTFIAATIMLNYFRWMKSAKIIFVAPTKPLVSQQVDACFNIAGIPRSQTTLLTGDISPGLRAEEWECRRVFFMTPQTLENDLSSGFADPKSIGLLVVDEAHRATGHYSYVKVVSFLRRFTSSFRILALTATPGSKVESVQEVIDSLGISHVEIRTEESIDIRQYVHQRDEDIVLLDPSDEMNHIKELYSAALKPLVDKLSQQNIYQGRDPMGLTTFGLLQARKDWMARAGQHVNQGVKFMMMAVFSVLTSLAHGIKLLNFHGIKPFYENLVQFRDETEGKGEKGSKYKKQIIESPSFQEMMDKIASWSKKDNFISHPKLTYLSDTVLNHFMDAGEGTESGPTNTRIIVFSEYRDSAEEIVRVLNTHKPLIRAAVFVGQADSKRSGGMKQAEQIERIQKFKTGEFNVLVATSIGEEGLDIGQVDLIICYDASASPIRMLQRMGRTGRKRAGRVVLLLMRGKEEDNYAKSKDGYEKMQHMICDGSRFNFRHDLSARIVPRDIRPEVDMRAVEIPVENTQAHGLPEPKKGRAKKKKPPKKFHMPDGVETGFASVASLLGKKSAPAKQKEVRKPVEEDEVVDVPALKRVLLTDSQTEELNKIYKHLPYYHRDSTEDIGQVDLTAHPAAQRKLRKTVHLKHGDYTKRSVKLFKSLAKASSALDPFEKPYPESDANRYRRLPIPKYGPDTDGEVVDSEPARKKRKVAAPISDDDDDEIVELSAPPSHLLMSKKAPKTTKQTTKPKEKVRRRAIEADDDDMIDMGERLPTPHKRTTNTKPKTSAPRRSRGRPKKQQKTQNTAAGYYDESADEGDDCRRTSDLELTDDSDSGADLEGFVVGDDVATSSNAIPTSSLPRRERRSSVTSPLSSSIAGNHSRPAKPQPKKPLYYEPTRFDATQDSLDDDDAIPSMSQLVKSKRASDRAAAAAAVVLDDSDDDTDVPVWRVSRNKEKANKIRAMLHDFDDDDDDDDEIIEESDGY
ncbi:P-loop containing nucleoside triphosphate hydrolase protein [Hypoxylon trugodes]|uniref:P-loop containing nucleoside triphosphate hydrolase protein n=1 Tax=Hypoxylon trugodes TaxID=326681 RepID=UPI00219F76B9|nr:P-loop containing nucleoside triphosphate hydrolase protein [Hypoxylon trugodes]KAI1390121.1 P-loop containing nucleoside triphosphate hydrolase protein [Hypoxylon trugodes]